MKRWISMLAAGLVAGAACAAPVEPTGAVPEAEGWKVSSVVRGLTHPWGLAFLPDGGMLITERPGQLRVVTADGELVGEPVKGVPEVLALRQGGLLDVALHPDFANNQLVYLTASTGTPDANRTSLFRGRFTGDALEDVQEVFRASPDKSNGFHFGSRLLWMPDGALLLSTGDGNNMRPAVQDLGTHLGKIVRLNDDGTARTGNPFYPRVDAAPEVYTYGHRNVQGLARDPKTGRVYATEHGPLGGDELNLIEPGRNYGWPDVTFGREYSGQTITDTRHAEGMTDAMVVWTPCIAPSGLAVYRGDVFKAWDGDILAGGLVLRQVRRIDLDDAGNVVGHEQLSIGKRVRDVRVGPDGYVYLLTDEERGEVLRLEPAE